MRTDDTDDRVWRRYRAPAPAASAGANATIETLLSHRSVRHFLPDPMPAGTLELLIAAAQSAATSSNVQAWSVVAVEDGARRARLAELAGRQAQIAQAPLLLVFLADLSRHARMGAARGEAMDGLDYLEAFLLAAVDAALAAQNVVVAAEALGLGTVYIGAMRNHPLEVAAELRLPPRCAAVFGLCVGRPDPTVATDVKPRLPQPVVLHRETYDAGAEADGVAGYDAALSSFRAEQGMTEVPWSRQTVERLRTAASLHGRHELAATLRAMGFALK